MASKQIQFQLGDQCFDAQLGTKIEKKALYGHSRRVIEHDGRSLSRGMLSADGRLLQRSETSFVKLDPEGTPVEPVTTEIDGEPAQLQPSAFEQPNPLTPTPLTRLASFAVSDVYPLDACSLEPGLYETTFAYRKSVQPKEALLLMKEDEAYLLTGVTKQATFLGLSVAYSFFDTEEEDTSEGDELDFSMV